MYKDPNEQPRFPTLGILILIIISIIKQTNPTTTTNPNTNYKHTNHPTPHLQPLQSQPAKTKMHFPTLTTILLATASMTTALPTTETLSIETRQAKQDLIDLWQDTGFLGLKFTGSGKVGECNELPKAKNNNFADNTSSGKAKKGFRCTIWVDSNCKGTGFSFNADPGSKKFDDWINDRASSWKCQKA